MHNKYGSTLYSAAKRELEQICSDMCQDTNGTSTAQLHAQPQFNV